MSWLLALFLLMTMLPTAALADEAPGTSGGTVIYVYPQPAMIQPPAMRAHPLKQLVQHLRRQLTVVPSICFQT